MGNPSDYVQNLGEVDTTLIGKVQPNGTGGTDSGRVGAVGKHDASYSNSGFQSSNQILGIDDHNPGVTYQGPEGSSGGQNQSGAVPNLTGNYGGNISPLGGVQPNGTGGRTGARTGNGFTQPRQPS